MKTSAVLLTIVALSLPSAAHAAKVYGIAVEGTTQSLVTWDSAAPNIILSSINIGGLPANETIAGMDFDPWFITGIPDLQRLYAISTGPGDTGNCYRIELHTGIAIRAFNSPSGHVPKMTGEHYGINFPGLDGVDGDNQDGFGTVYNEGGGPIYRLEFALSDVHAGVTPHLVHLIDHGVAIDTGVDALVQLLQDFDSPRDVGTIGPLGVDFDDEGGFDVDNATGTAYAALQPAGVATTNFYTVNRQTGGTTLVGPIGGGLLIKAMAVEPLPRAAVPEPSTALLLALGLVACVGLRGVRRQA